MSNAATAIQTPIKLPSWDDLAQMCTLFAPKGEQRPLALAKAGNAAAYKQLPLLEEDELAAVVTRANPSDGLRYGFAPKAQLF